MPLAFSYNKSMDKIKICGNPIYNGKVNYGADIVIPVPSDLVPLVLSNNGDDWDLMCSKLPSYGFMNPIGKVMISHLLVNAQRRKFL